MLSTNNFNASYEFSDRDALLIMKKYDMAFFHGRYVTFLTENITRARDTNHEVSCFDWVFKDYIRSERFAGALMLDADKLFFQHRLIKELEFEIRKGTESGNFSEISQKRIFTTINLIENITLDKADLPSLDLLKSSGTIWRGWEYNQQILDPIWKQSLSQLSTHWGMMIKLYQNLSSESNPYISRRPEQELWGHSDEQLIEHSEFYQSIYQTCPWVVFPPCDQTIFLEVWKTRFHQVDDSFFKVHLLRKIYSQNKGLFWLPIIGSVLQKKPIHEDYWRIASHIGIPKSDAASYMDFLYRWVFPSTFSRSDVKPILLEFRQILTQHFGNFSCHFDPVANFLYIYD
jgi:hypothetical protein